MSPLLMETGWRIAGTVVPLIIMVGTGFLYARRTHTDMTVANRLNMDVFTPALIFSVMSAKSFDPLSHVALAVACAGLVLGSGVLVWPLCRVLGFRVRTFVPPMMFNNSGNLGIPLLVLAFGEAALPAAVLLFLVSTLLHFTVGMAIVSGRASVAATLRSPIILATAAGLVWSATGQAMPPMLKTPIDMLGQIAIPLMLFALGVRMTGIDFSHWRAGAWGALLCPLSGVIMALIMVPVLGLDSTESRYLILFGALPPAVLNYMVAERYQQEPEVVASVVLIGNLASLVFIPLTLGFVL